MMCRRISVPCLWTPSWTWRTPLPANHTTLCVRGCTVRGRHLSTCPEPAADTATCTGCQPRQATLGRLCDACTGRITRAVLDAPHLVEWLRDNVAPGATTDAPRVAGTREAPAPLSLTALDDIDSIYVTLVHAVVSYCAAAGLVGPKLTGIRTALAHGQAPHRVTGLRREVPNHVAVAQIAAWVLDHHEGMVHQPWAGSWHDDITGAVSTASKRWPRQDPARKLPIPCPSCDRVMLRMHPPMAAGHPTTVACHASECGRVLTEADYWLRAQTLYSERARALKAVP